MNSKPKRFTRQYAVTLSPEQQNWLEAEAVRRDRTWTYLLRELVERARTEPRT